MAMGNKINTGDGRDLGRGYRAFWIRMAVLVPAFVVLAGGATVLRIRQASEEGVQHPVAIIGWAAGATVAFFLLLGCISVRSARAQQIRLARKESGEALVVQRTVELTKAIRGASGREVRLPLLSVMLVDASGVVFYDRQSSVFSLEWTKVAGISPVTTRLAGLDMPAVGMSLEGMDGGVIPLIASRSALSALFPMSAKAARALTAWLSKRASSGK